MAKKNKLKIQLRKSLIGKNPRQKKIIHALGLRKINQTVIKEANPAILGMVNSVAHMITVEEVK